MIDAARMFLGTLLLATAALAAWAQAKPEISGLEFSGLWKQANDRCQPPRKGEVRLRIEERSPALTVETSIASDSGTVRHAVQRYSTDGKPSVTTGADGDEFHTSVVWKDGSLVFTIEEHEDGRIRRSKETWTLIENGSVLQRMRESLDKGAKQILIYVRERPGSTAPGLPSVGQTINHICYLIPDSIPGNCSTGQEVNPRGMPRVLQFSARFSFQGITHENSGSRRRDENRQFSQEGTYRGGLRGRCR